MFVPILAKIWLPWRWCTNGDFFGEIFVSYIFSEPRATHFRPAF